MFENRKHWNHRQPKLSNHGLLHDKNHQSDNNYNFCMTKTTNQIIITCFCAYLTRAIETINNGSACSVLFLSTTGLFPAGRKVLEHDTFRQCHFLPPCSVRILSMSKNQSDFENIVINCLIRINCIPHSQSNSSNFVQHVIMQEI